MLKKKLQKLFPIFIIVLFITINLVRNVIKNQPEDEQTNVQNPAANSNPDPSFKGGSPTGSVYVFSRFDMISEVPTAPIPNEIPMNFVLSYQDPEGDISLFEAELSDGQKFKIAYPLNYFYQPFFVKTEGSYTLSYKFTDSSNNIFTYKTEFDVVQSKLPAESPVINYFENKGITYLDFTSGLNPAIGYHKIIVNFNDGSKPETVVDMRIKNRNAVLTHKFAKTGNHTITVNYLKQNKIGGLAGSQDYHIQVLGNINKNFLYPHYAYFRVKKVQKGSVELVGLPQLDQRNIKYITWAIKGKSAWSFWESWISLFINKFITHDTNATFKLKKGTYIFELEVEDHDGNIGRKAQVVKVP